MTRGLPAPYLEKYFARDGVEWQIADSIRRMVDYRELNLIESWNGVPAMDLVLMRNVLIYFDVPTRIGILGRVRLVLRPAGCLLLGSAETTLNLDDEYDRVAIGKAVCYRSRG